MMKMEKARVEVVVGNMSGYDFDGAINKVIDRLVNLRVQHGPDLVLQYGEWDLYDDSKSFNLVKVRLETDEEFASRCEKESEIKKARIQSLEAELVRLRGE